MQLKSRPRPVFEISGLGPYSASPTRRRRRVWPWALAALVALAAAALAFGHFSWPRGALRADPAGLARLSRPSFGAGNMRVFAHTADGTAVPVEVHKDGVVWPQRQVVPGTAVHVQAVFTRPGWVGWLAGRTQQLSLWVSAPSVHVQQTWLQVAAKSPLVLHFSRAVSEVEVMSSGQRHLHFLAHPASTFALNGLDAAGSIAVSAVTRRWQQLPRPETITWFPAGGKPKVLVSPDPGTMLAVHTPLVLRFSEPVKDVFHGHMPWAGRVPGSWHVTDTHTLVFTPRGFGFGLDTPVRVRLPAAVEELGSDPTTTRLLTWKTPTGTELGLQRLLADLGYLPLRWHSSSAAPAATIAAQVQAAASPPAGQFTWRFANVPASLRHLWQPGTENVVTRGAIMAFESDHGLTADGDAGRAVWQAAIADAVAGKHRNGDYSYVIVHRDQRPQTLVLWHDGHTLLTTPANTGIPAAPTVFGTFPVYARFTVTTMKGTNPDGTHYSDPGIPWVSYFNGGDAIHGFTRASYGSPQSLGCVELPASEAAKVWPYTPIGTLVTVTS
jgi:peptidoglycan hydrolase-like protein with peptidoglycan-binding domain